MIEMHEAQSVPSWVIFHHRLARLGQATSVFTRPDSPRTLVRFEMDPTTAEKWLDLAEAEVAWIVYDPRRRK